MDLPFAQKRWCGAFGVDKVKNALPTTRAMARSARATRTLIARTCASKAARDFRPDKSNVIRHVEYVKEAVDYPNATTRRWRQPRLAAALPPPELT